jgi:hypothetical protein
MHRVLALALVGACSARPSGEAPPRPSPVSASPAPACDQPRRALAPGLTVERVFVAPPPTGTGDGCLTLVRVDLAQYRIEARMAAHEGGPRRVPDWAAQFGLAAVINASMYDHDGRSVSLLVDGERVDKGRDNRTYGGFLAWDPVDPAAPPAVMAGRDCPGFDLADLRRRYRSIVQNYRLLGCQGEPVAWQDAKQHSSAAIGLDRQGRLVMCHSRTAYQMATLSVRLADPALELVGMLYVEGGPEASLWARGPDETVASFGSFETGFFGEGNDDFWPIPNVIGVVPR